MDINSKNLLDEGFVLFDDAISPTGGFYQKRIKDSFGRTRFFLDLKHYPAPTLDLTFELWSSKATFTKKDTSEHFVVELNDNNKTIESTIDFFNCVFHSSLTLASFITCRQGISTLMPKSPVGKPCILSAMRALPCVLFFVVAPSVSEIRHTKDIVSGFGKDYKRMGGEVPAVIRPTQKSFIFPSK